MTEYLFTEAGCGFPGEGDLCQVDDGCNDDPMVIVVTKTFGIQTAQWGANTMLLEGEITGEESTEDMPWVKAVESEEECD